MSNAISAALLPEFDREMETTRKILERVPMDKAGWQPHGKSAKLGNLAIHVARLSSFGAAIVNQESVDMGTGAFKNPEIKTTEELVALFDKSSAEARKAIESATDEDLQKTWTLKMGDKIIFSMPRAAVLRVFMMSHLIHHRAQLGVYLRMNDIAIPGSYGPSADEPVM